MSAICRWNLKEVHDTPAPDGKGYFKSMPKPRQFFFLAIFHNFSVILTPGTSTPQKPKSVEQNDANLICSFGWRKHNLRSRPVHETASLANDMPGEGLDVRQMTAMNHLTDQWMTWFVWFVWFVTIDERHRNTLSSGGCNPGSPHLIGSQGVNSSLPNSSVPRSFCLSRTNPASFVPPKNSPWKQRVMPVLKWTQHLVPPTSNQYIDIWWNHLPRARLKPHQGLERPRPRLPTWLQPAWPLPNHCHHIVIISSSLSSLSQSLVPQPSTTEGSEGFPTPKVQVDRFWRERVERVISVMSIRTSGLWMAWSMHGNGWGGPQRSPRGNSGALGCFEGRSSEGGLVWEIARALPQQNVKTCGNTHRIPIRNFSYFQLKFPNQKQTVTNTSANNFPANTRPTQEPSRLSDSWHEAHQGHLTQGCESLG